MIFDFLSILIYHKIHIGKQPLEKDVSMTAQYFFVKYAKGQDGGFGDYRSPDWECAEYLKDDNGNLLWFSSEKEAGKFV